MTDSLQARVHAARGRFCIVKRDEHLPSWFGEPSLGRAKTLTVEYEINGSLCGVLCTASRASMASWAAQWHRLDDHRRDANDASPPPSHRAVDAAAPARRVGEPHATASTCRERTRRNAERHRSRDERIDLTRRRDDADHASRDASPAAGSAGEMHEYELNGKLMYPMSVAASPSVAPQILIENASYGWTEELLEEWKARYHKDIFDMLISASPSTRVHLTRCWGWSLLTEMPRAGKRSGRKGLLD